MSGNTGKKFNTFKLFYATSALVVVGTAAITPAYADVVDGTFVSGSGTFTQDPNKTTITVNTTSSITEFKDYNIPEGDEVHYQHSADIGHSRNLSRVTGGNASSIMGRLTSEDVDVFLINPNGVIFGKNSAINVPSLVTSTTDITNANFNASNYKFDIKSQNPNAKIINNGNITVSEGGLAALVAPDVENNGIIIATKGKVALGGGDEFTLDMYGDKLVSFAVSDDEKVRLVKQSGTIAAKEGVVLLTVQDANKVVSNVVNLTGVTEAKEVKVEGDQIVLGARSVIRAKDGNNGGKVTIKGRVTKVDKDAEIYADATDDGDGGDVGVFGDDTLDFDGVASAQGKGAGKGGLIETSGEVVNIGDETDVNTLDENGGSGMWLVDPSDFTIGASGSGNANATTLANNLKSGNVTIATTGSGGNGDIFVNAIIGVSATALTTSGIGSQPQSRTLFLNANRDIKVADNINIGITGASVISPTVGNRSLNVSLNADRDIILGSNVHITTQGGKFSVNNLAGNGFANSFTLGAGSVIDTTKGGLLGISAGTVDVKAHSITTNGTINTNATVTDAAINLTSDGTGDINVNNNLDAGLSNVTITNSGNGKITTGVAGAINANQVKLTTADGDITTNGTITAAETGLLGDSAVISSTNGIVTVNNTITAGTNVLGTLGGGVIKLNSTNGVVRLLHDIQVGGLGTVDIQAGNHVDLNGKIKGSGVNSTILSLFGGVLPPELTSLGEIYTLTGKAPVVNVLSNAATINQGIKIVNAGGTVDLAGGTTFDQTVHINKSLTLQGHLGTIIAPTTMPILDSNYTGLSLTTISPHGYLTASLPITVQPIVFVDNAANVKIDGVEVSGAGVTTPLGGLTGVGYYNSTGTSSNSSVHNLHDTVPTGTGIHADGATTALDVDNVDVSEYDLAGVHSTNGATVNVKNGSTITGGGSGVAQTGVLFDNGGKGSVDGSTITGNTGTLSAGVTVLNGGAGIKITDNTISGSEAGVAISGTDGVEVSSNTITGNLAGILSNASSFGKFIDNDINLAAAGILINGGDQDLVQGGHINLTLGGIALVGTTNTTIDNVTIAVNGVGVAEDNADGTTVKNSHITGSLIGVASIDSNDLTVDNTNIIGSLLDGIYLSNSNSAMIKNSTIALSLHDNIEAVGSQDLVIDHDLVLGSFGNGIELTGDYNATIQNSIIGLNLGDGVHADGSDSLRIEHSAIGLNAGNGVALVDSADAEIINSAIGLNAKAGVYAENSDRLYIDPSFIFGNNVGVDLVSSDNATISNSFVFLNTTDGVRANDSDNLLVTGSVIGLNGDNGINLQNGSDDARVRFSLIGLNGQDGIHADSSNNLTVFLSAIGLNKDDGIDLNNSKDAKVILSTVSLNGDNGIEATDSGNLIVVLSAVLLNNNDGIHLTGSDNAYVVLSAVSGNGDDGIDANSSKNLNVIASAVTYNDDDGIDLDGSKDAKVILSSVSHNGDNGIEADGSDNLNVILSAIDNNDNDGIHLTDSNAANVILSLVSNNGDDGIDANYSKNLTVVASAIDGNDDDGVDLDHVDNTNIVLSDVSHNKDNGVEADNSDKLHVILSRVTDNGNDGIHLNESGRARVILSDVSDNGDDGVDATGSDDLAIVLSAVKDNGGDGVRLDTSGSANIILSSISNNKDNGIEATDSDALHVILSKVAGNTNNGISLNSSDDAEVEFSNVSDNGGDGIMATDSDNANVSGSTISGNGVNGAEFVDSDGATIDTSNIDDNANNGVEVANSDDLSVTNSFVFNNKTGINANDSDRLTVNNTEVHGNTVNGLYLGNGLGLYVTASNFYENNIGINLFSSTGLIENTMISSNGGPFGMLVDGNGGPLNVDLTNVVFLGTQSDSALKFQNATFVGDVQVSGVQFRSNAPTGWKFEHVSGEAPKDTFNGNDLNFNDTVFAHSYSHADIELVNSTMDGFAENATFEGDGGSAAAREDRVIHVFDDSALGTIFYTGYVKPGIDIGNLAADIANRTDLGEDYYRTVSTAGKIYSGPSLKAPQAKTINTTMETKVNISGNNITNINLPTKSAAQLAGLAPAAGGDDKGLNDLETASGPQGKANCSVNYVNNFLADSLSGGVDGSCQ